MPVAVLVPFSSSEPWRLRAWDSIRGHYEREHGWPIHVGQCDGEWSKGAAVADALAQTDADILVIADADSWVRPQHLTETVEAVQTQPWGMPHRRVHRLSVQATEAHYRGERDTQVHRAPYGGVIGGGITVIQRSVYEDCPIDPRFLGWGGEDVSWGNALYTFHGRPWRPHGESRLWHLWHPPDNVGLMGSPASEALTERYSRAFNRPDRMRPLVEEAKRCFPIVSSPTP